MLCVVNRSSATTSQVNDKHAKKRISILHMGRDKITIVHTTVLKTTVVLFCKGYWNWERSQEATLNGKNKNDHIK